MASAFVGNFIGGYLPTWVGLWQRVEATDSLAYGGALLIVSGLFFLSLLPLTFLRAPQHAASERTLFAPIDYAKRHPSLLFKMIFPTLLTSIGAGLIMPFMNVFFRNVHGLPDPVIGNVFAWGSLAMGAGLLAAPALADRIGKIELVVITQALSIPFLIALGFAPWFWVSALAFFVRLALMNMSSPIYSTFVMEQVEPGARATVASLTSMAWSFGWVVSPAVSGAWQVKYGFGPPFLGTIILYTIAIVLYWAFFLYRQPRKKQPEEMGKV
jgi:MFS family permease